MLGFVEDLVRESLAGVLEEVFYDSKACLCAFEFAQGFDLKGHIAEIVLSCAKSHISQFIWDGRYEQSDAFDDMGNED